MAYCKGAGAPGRAAAHFRNVGKDGEGVTVAERDKDQAVVGKGAHSGDRRRLLAAAHGAGGDEDAGKLARQRALLPQASGGVDESLIGSQLRLGEGPSQGGI